MDVSKRLYMGVSTHTYDDVLTHLHTCVLQRRPLIVAERQHIAHGKPDFCRLSMGLNFMLFIFGRFDCGWLQTEVISTPTD